jgi:hypothetical protein
MQRFGVLLFFVLGVAVVTATSPGCNLFNDLGDAWTNADATSAGAGGNMCPSAGGAGGGGGDGGDGGAGGEGDGAGGDGSSVGAGVGGSFGVSVGAGVGGGDARTNGNNGHTLRAPRHRGHHGGLGTAQQAGCAGMPAAWILPPIPASVPLPTGAVTLSTTRLRFVCAKQNIGNGATGIQFNNACGLAFENWVLWTLQFKPNKTPIKSPQRQVANSKNGGLPASVIPDYLQDLTLEDADTGKSFTFPNSALGEVKAVAGNLTPGYNQWQMLGLLDVARRAPVTSLGLMFYPPPLPVLELITTGNTVVPVSTISQASLWGVMLVQQMVYEVPVMPNDPNPDLCLGAKVVLNVTVDKDGPGWPCSKLTSPPPNWVTLIQGDPDPPTVDG